MAQYFDVIEYRSNAVTKALADGILYRNHSHA